MTQSSDQFGVTLTCAPCIVELSIITFPDTTVKQNNYSRGRGHPLHLVLFSRCTCEHSTGTIEDILSPLMKIVTNTANEIINTVCK